MNKSTWYEVKMMIRAFGCLLKSIRFIRIYQNAKLSEIKKSINVLNIATYISNEKDLHPYIRKIDRELNVIGNLEKIISQLKAERSETKAVNEQIPN